MQFTIKILAVIGLVFIGSIIYLNLDMVSEYRKSKSLVTGDHECESKVLTRSNRNDGLQADYIIYNCDDENLHRIEITRYSGKDVLENQHIIVELKENTSDHLEPKIYLVVMDNNEIYVEHSNDVEIPSGEIGSFKITTSLIEEQ